MPPPPPGPALFRPRSYQVKYFDRFSTLSSGPETPFFFQVGGAEAVRFPGSVRKSRKKQSPFFPSVQVLSASFQLFILSRLHFPTTLSQHRIDMQVSSSFSFRFPCLFEPPPPPQLPCQARASTQMKALFLSFNTPFF